MSHYEGAKMVMINIQLYDGVAHIKSEHCRVQKTCRFTFELKQ